MNDILKLFSLDNDAPVGLVSLGIKHSITSKKENIMLEKFNEMSKIFYNNNIYNNLKLQTLSDFIEAD